MAEYSRIGIIGVGLIGGSLGLAIKHFFPSVTVVGIDQDRKGLSLARKKGAIDIGATRVQELEGMDLVILATPIHHILKVIPALSKVITSETIVTDTGSTKKEIIKVAKKYLPKQFIGGHPLAGSERQGIIGAHPFMFENAPYVLTPLQGIHAKEKKLASFFKKLGAQPLFLDAASHDRLAAYVSHLPQLLAVSLTHVIARHSKRNRLFQELAAGGFRDLTRIASSPFGIWKDILETNRSEIVNALEDFSDAIENLKKDMKRLSLEDFFKKAKKFRDELPIRSKGFIRKLHRLAVVIPDKPGVFAEITGAIARQKISIKDIELLKAREGDGGNFYLYFENEKDLNVASKILRSKGYPAQELQD